MKNYVLLTLVASALLPLIADAQIPTTQAECLRRCVLSPLPPNLSEGHEARIKAIQAKKKEEKEAEKLKALQKEEEEENDRNDRAREKICTAICRHNPVG
ncbi:hypothetical protein ACL9RI_11005 [Janthinobacterium sp. Mn2066]|uniref:hypothetical protein n=1 Tax=Janthinobacterium sp. Mn2066 TaxID=3395264 RepID=UPI003BBFCB83